MSSEQSQDPHTPRRHMSEQAWQPVPQGGDYDADATAFVQLPDGYLDYLDPSGMPSDADPLAAPGHGYVPPPIVPGQDVQPVPPAVSAEPGTEGQWTMPFTEPGPEQGQGRSPASAAGSGSSAPADGGWGAAPPSGAAPWTVPAESESPGESDDPPPGGGNRTDQTEWHGQSGQWQDPGGASPEQWYSGHQSADDGAHHSADDGAHHSALADHWPFPGADDHLPAEAAEPGTAPSYGTGAAYGAQGAPDPWNPQNPPGTAAPGPWYAQNTGSPAGTEESGERRDGGTEATEGPGEDHSGQWTAQYPSGGYDGASRGDAVGEGGAGNPPAGGDGAPEAASRPGTAETPGVREEREGPEPGHDFAAADGDPVAGSGGPGDHRAPSGADMGEEPRTDGESTPPERGADSGDSGASGSISGAASEPEVPFAEELHSEHPYVSYVLTVNGFDRPVSDAWIGESLLYVLRERLGLAGAKDGCSQGECGACSIEVDGRLVASCLVPAATSAGCDIRTVEGLPVDGLPSDVQRALAESGAVQCGFCVPGLTMTVHDLLKGNHAPTELEARQAICGNLCRCSGYRGVLEAVRQVVARRAEPAEAPADEEADPSGDAPRIPHQTTLYGGGHTGDLA